jgi:uncharacterized OsmC-like protein
MSNKTLHASAQSLEKFQIKCEARGFSYLLDEASEDGGTNIGMTPLESLLASMAACKCITARAAAPLRKIDLVDLRIDVYGDIGRNNEKKRQILTVTSEFHIKANNATDEIEKFVTFVESHCPAHNTLLYGAEMKTEIVIE